MKITCKTIAFILLASMFLLFSTCKKDKEPTPVLKAVALYFNFWDESTVNKIDLVNTPNARTILYDGPDGITGPAGITLTSDGYLIVTDNSESKILKMHKSATGPVDVIYDFADGISSPTAITVDNATGIIYWCNSGTNQVMKGQADGSAAPETLFGGAAVINDAYGIAIDKMNNMIYICDFTLGIKKGNLDGSGTMSVLYDNINYPSMGAPSNIFVSPERNKIYWADEASNEIIVANLDGTGTPTVLFDFGDGVNRADGIYVDYQANKIYWSETTTEVIARGNLDGSGSREVLVDNVETYGLILEFQ